MDEYLEMKIKEALESTGVSEAAIVRAERPVTEEEELLPSLSGAHELIMDWAKRDDRLRETLETQGMSLEESAEEWILQVLDNWSTYDEGGDTS